MALVLLVGCWWVDGWVLSLMMTLEGGGWRQRRSQHWVGGVPWGGGVKGGARHFRLRYVVVSAEIEHQEALASVSIWEGGGRGLVDDWAWNVTMTLALGGWQLRHSQHRVRGRGDVDCCSWRLSLQGCFPSTPSLYAWDPV